MFYEIKLIKATTKKLFLKIKKMSFPSFIQTLVFRAVFTNLCTNFSKKSFI